MTGQDRAGGALLTSPIGRITVMLGLLFLGYGVTTPYLSRWLAETHGLNGVQIAAVTSTAAVLRLAIGPMIAAWADGFGDRRRPLQLLAVGAFLAAALFSQVQGFWALAAAGFVSATLSAALTPLLEGAALRASQTGPLPFGLARATASAAFVLGTLGGALGLVPFGIGVVMVFFVTSAALAAAMALFGLLPDPAPAGASSRGFAERMAAVPSLWANPRYRLAVLAGAAIQCAHAFYYGFSVLVWTRQGLADPLIGALWAFGVIAEIIGLAALPWIERRVSPPVLLMIGAGAAVVRWLAFAFLPPAWLLWPLQALHAGTFAAAHVGALRMIQRETPEAAAGVGQSLYAALASGTALGLSALLAGALYDRVGVWGYLAMAGLGAIGLWFSFALWRRCR